MEKLIGWWMIWAWIGGAVAASLAVSSYYVWRAEVNGIAIDEDKLAGRIFLAIIWPVTIFGGASISIICASLFGLCYGFFYAPFYLLPRWVARRYVARRKAIVDAELAEKQAADEARHEVERGAHR